MKIQILWEKLLHGSNAFFVPSKIKRFSSAISRKIAIMKMENIRMISDEFNSESVFFEPLAWILVESSGKLFFWGVYSSQSDDENDTLNLPQLCIRKANWCKTREKEALKSVEKPGDLDRYFFGEEHIKSEIFFLQNDKKITEFVKKAFNVLLVDKLDFSEVEKESEISYLKIYIYHEFIECKISYSPCVQAENKIENLVNDWINLLNSVDKSNIIISDNKLRISYQDSLLSYIKEFWREDKAGEIHTG